MSLTIFSLILDSHDENSLRVPSSHSSLRLLDDVGKCIAFLKDMEVRWSGAKRSRLIIEKLLQHQRIKLAPEHNDNQSQSSISPAQERSNINKRTLDDLEDTNTMWGEQSESDLFPFNPLDPVLFASWH